MLGLSLTLICLISVVNANTIGRHCSDLNDPLIISCDTGYSIHINSANYGRTQGSEICPGPIRTTDCYSSTSTSIVTAACEGQQTCSVLASHLIFGDPCVGTFKYLEVDYQCVPTFTQEIGCAFRKKTCDGGSFSLRCPCSKPAIHICDAFYGRQVPVSEFCPYSSAVPQSTDCIEPNAFSKVKEACQGKPSCDTTNLGLTDPCYGTFKYLDIGYTCALKSQTCEGSVMTLSCDPGTNLFILDAFYGRVTGIEICPQSQANNETCKVDGSLGVVKALCEGENACTVSAANGVFGDSCDGTKYLEVLYDCI